MPRSGSQRRSPDTATITPARAGSPARSWSQVTAKGDELLADLGDFSAQTDDAGAYALQTVLKGVQSPSVADLFLPYALQSFGESVQG